jgi:SAM-dependent methyltransferase
VRTVQANGSLRALKLMRHAVLDASWDFVHGTETLTRIPPQNLETDSSNKGQATMYGATRARPFMQLLNELNLSRDGVFVDLGCGKGRVVLIAAQYGFKKVIGVDFSKPLCQIARNNVAAFGRRRKLKSDIHIVHADVVHYPIQSDDTTFFLYDPFSAKVLNQVLENIRQSLTSYPRNIWMIYNSPAYHD